MRTLVLGDVHGAHKALVQVLERCGFKPKVDRIVFVGDVADGWPDTRECIDELLRIPNLVHLLGNHDEWFAEWARGGHPGEIWLSQGGQNTVDSYGGHRTNIPPPHLQYLHRAKAWHEEGGRIYVHGGWPWEELDHPSKCHDTDQLTWDRSLWRSALQRHALGDKTPLTSFREVYVGHTTTTRAGFLSLPTAARSGIWIRAPVGKGDSLSWTWKPRSFGKATSYPRCTRRKQVGDVAHD